jgi:hypothetical protein
MRMHQSAGLVAHALVPAVFTHMAVFCPCAQASLLDDSWQRSEKILEHGPIEGLETYCLYSEPHWQCQQEAWLSADCIKRSKPVQHSHFGDGFPFELHWCSHSAVDDMMCAHGHTENCVVVCAGTGVVTPVTLVFSETIPKRQAITRPSEIIWTAGDGVVDLNSLRMCSK